MLPYIGMVNGHAMLEYMLQHAAQEMAVDPLELRSNNLMFEGTFKFISYK